MLIKEELTPMRDGETKIPTRSHLFFTFTGISKIRHTGILLGKLGLPLLFIGVGFGWFIVPAIIKQIILSKIVLSPEANPDLYAAWIHPPMPVYLKIYLFNVTNPDEMQKGSLPKLQELGPYVFRENRTKFEITHDDPKDTVTYREHITFHFEQELSGNVTLQDKITLINVPFVAAAIKITNGLPWPLNMLGKMILLEHKEPLFVRKTADEVLFKGWVVPFLQKIEENVGITMLPDSRFGLFLEQNDTKYGPFTVSRGAKNKESYGKILKYKNESELNVWKKHSSCNQIRGSDGTIFPPFVEKDTLLKMFNPDLCMSIHLTYNNSIEYEGIQGYRFTPPASMFEDSRKSVENRCHCVTIDDEPEKCLKRGALDFGPCRDGLPIATSPAHFLDSDSQYVEDSGLIPDGSKHQTIIDVEPMTGVLLRASKKLQVNLRLKRVKGISIFSHVPEMLVPLTWADECASLDEGSRGKLESILFYIRILDVSSKFFFVAVALVISVFLLSTRKEYHSVPAVKS